MCCTSFDFSGTVFNLCKVVLIEVSRNRRMWLTWMQNRRTLVGFINAVHACIFVNQLLSVWKSIFDCAFIVSNRWWCGSRQGNHSNGFWLYHSNLTWKLTHCQSPASALQSIDFAYFARPEKRGIELAGHALQLQLDQEHASGHKSAASRTTEILLACLLWPLTRKLPISAPL